MTATVVTGQLVFDGIVNGLAIGLIALGVVLVYRSSRVVNFAVGNLGLVGAALLALLALDYGVPFWLAALVAVVTGTLVGAVVELVVVRRLFDAARVTLLVATIGVAQLALAAVEALPPIEGALGVSYPAAVDGAWSWGSVRVSGPQLAILVAVPLLAAGLSWALNRTLLGRAVAAAADNARLARTVGINPKLASTAVWAAAGLLSTVSMVLLAGQSGRVASLTDLGPNTMVRALAAAVLAGMVSFRRALGAGVVIGVAQALVRFNFPDQTGLIDVLLFLAVLAAVAVQVRGQATRESSAEGAFPGLAARAMVVPPPLQRVWWARLVDHLALGALLAVGVALPLVVTRPSSQLVYATVLAFAICATSLTVLTGWAGRLSLGQMGFAGLGALLAAALARGLETSLGLGGVTLLRLDLPALTFPTAVAVAALAMAVLAGLIGMAALRVRGLLLAVITFAFGLAAAQYLYRRPALSAGATSSVRGNRTELWGLDLASQRTYYYVVLGTLVLVLVVVARLRRTGVGRATIAVRDNATGAAAFTVSPFRTQVTAFALSGGLAGLGGALLAGAVANVPLTERFFQVDDSLLLVAIVVIGGLGSTTGPVLGAIWVVGLPALFPDNDLVPLFASSLGLLVLLLYLPGGLITIPHQMRGWLFAITLARSPAVTVSPTPTARPDATPSARAGRPGQASPPATTFAGRSAGRADVTRAVPGTSAAGAGDAGQAAGSTAAAPPATVPAAGPAGAVGADQPMPRAKAVGGTPKAGAAGAPAVPVATPGVGAGRPVRATLPASVGDGGGVGSGDEGPVLVAEDVVVRFGGNTAVDGAGIAVGAGEMVGLIGTNGAGKSTLLNAVGGFVVAEGRFELLGQDVTGLAAHRRAALGLGRTFQAAPLFATLTVREAILVALEARGRTGFLASALFLPPATRTERSRRAETGELIDLLGLGEYADLVVAELSTGTRRIVELAGLLALDARVLCLDEPTAGLAQRETEALGPLLDRLRRDLGASMVVVEHDMPFIRSISDRLVCLEAGKVIADGAPDEVVRDPGVVASYLGTDERALARSGHSDLSTARGT